jgi:hypothetical protein
MRKSLMAARLWESPEYQAAQLAFDFGRVARVVAPIIKRLRKALRAWEHKRPARPTQPAPERELFGPQPKETAMTQHYIGTKQIVAWEQEKDGQPGYAVKYPDGYTSWSPKATFEAAYLPQGNDPSRIPEQMVDDFIAGHESTRMGNHTVVLVRLRNGFTIIEESACVDPANYDHALGERLALAKAKNKVWGLLGFLLATARNGVNPA